MLVIKLVWISERQGISAFKPSIWHRPHLTRSKKDLEKLFLGNLMNQAKKLANLSGSQANESLNNTIASKAPKAKHYSASASQNYMYRVGTAVLQKNEGYSYVSKVGLYNHVLCENCFQILYLHSVYTMNQSATTFVIIPSMLGDE